MGESLSHLGLGKDVSDGAQKAQVLKQKYDIWNFIKIKKRLLSEEQIRK